MFKPTAHYTQYGFTICESEGVECHLKYFPQNFSLYYTNPTLFEDLVLAAIHKLVGRFNSTKEIKEVRVQKKGARVMGESWEVVYGEYDIEAHSGVCRGFIPKKPTANAAKIPAIAVNQAVPA